jgi:hypothetical protein
MYKILYALFLCLLLACQGARDNSSRVKSYDVKQYYFPIDSLNTPRIYHYKLAGNEEGDIYWIMSRSTENNKTYLWTRGYEIQRNPPLVLTQVIKELINDDGARVKEYNVFQSFGDTVQQRSAQIEDDEVFAWKTNKTKVLKWHFDIKSDNTSALNLKIERHRSFTEDHAKIHYKGKEIDAIGFTDTSYIHSLHEKTREENEIRIIETSYYAAGIGLAEKRENGTVKWTLADILSMDEWNKVLNTHSPE